MSVNLSSSRKKPVLNIETSVSSFDRLNSWLIAIILIVGFLVLTMFLMWMTSGKKYTPQLIPIDVSTVSDEEDEGEADDPEDPGVEEFPDVETPQLMNALEAIPDAVSSVVGALEEASGSATQQGKGNGRGRKKGDGVPEYKRWIIEYEADSIATYSRQLSFFNIDIGVFYRTIPTIVRLNDPANAKTVIQSNRDSEKKTLRFMHKQARMKRWDDELARRANISLDPDGLTCQFYPESTRQIIRQVEAEALQKANRQLKDVRNTVLKVEAGGSGYIFKVVDITYR